MGKNSNYETAQQYVLVSPEAIRIATPPSPLDAKQDSTVYKFYDPRGHNKGGGFDKQKMLELEQSIIQTGLQLPLLVREVIDRDGSFLELIAGERRLRTILNLKKKTKNGKPITVYNLMTERSQEVTKVYERIPVRIASNCDDLAALRLAMEENENSQPLTTADHVDLVESLIAVGMKPQQICEKLNKNPAWVNHTIHFRKKLPKNCFEALMAGQINRNVAEVLMRYDEENREEIWTNALSILIGKRKKKQAELEQKLEEASGKVEVTSADVELANDLGLDEKEAKKAAEKANSEYTQVTSEVEQFKSNPPTLTGGDIETASSMAGVKPKTPQALNKKKIEKYYLEPLREALGITSPGGDPDPSLEYCDSVTGEVFPQRVLLCAVNICEGVVNSEQDVFEVLREFMIDCGDWQCPD